MQRQRPLSNPQGPNDGWNLIHSTAIYYQEYVAAAQAQQLWNASGIQRLYKEGKIQQARYGIEEVETYYCRWPGGLDDPEKPWTKEQTRAEHMASRAMEQTITHALDVDRFKESLGLSAKWFSDAEILESLHWRRARSKYVAESARAESERSLKENNLHIRSIDEE
jgi:hypothetical protein